MKLDEFWKKRESIHQKKLFKYLKYVFNDHFVLVLIFFSGALGFWYSEYVKTVEPGEVFPRIILLVLLFLCLFIGKFATLLQPADNVFLLPLEDKMSLVLRRMKRRSMVFPVVLLLLIAAASMPLLVAIGTLSFSQWILLAGTLILLKDGEMENQFFSFQITHHHNHLLKQWGIYVGGLAALFLFLFVNPWIGLIGALLVNLGIRYTVHKHQSNRWNWEKLIEEEEIRLQRIYRFMNLFTDIPSLSDRPKRRKWADALINKFPSQKENPHLYLYLRGFMRGSSYSGLYVRLVAIGAVLIGFSNQMVISVLIALVFLYLIGFQLIPLYYHFDHAVLFRLYPISPNGKEKAIQRLLLILLIIASMLFGGVGIVSLGLLDALWLVLLSLIFSLFFVWIYMPRRLQKK